MKMKISWSCLIFGHYWVTTFVRPQMHCQACKKLKYKDGRYG